MYKYLVGVVAILYSSVAWSELIAFEESGIYKAGDSFQSGGLSFTTNGNDISYFSLTDQDNIVGNGSSKLAAANKNVLTISTIDTNQLFSVNSLFAGGFWTDPDHWFMSATGLDFTGQSSNGIVTYRFDFSSFDELQFVYLPDLFKELTSLEITPYNGITDKTADDHDYYSFVLDDLEVTIHKVSEPKMFLLMLLFMIMHLGLRVSHRKNLTVK